MIATELSHQLRPILVAAIGLSTILACGSSGSEDGSRAGSANDTSGPNTNETRRGGQGEGCNDDGSCDAGLECREGVCAMDEECADDTSCPPAAEGMVLIPAGRFTMGSPLSEPYHGADEMTHEVTLTRPFFMSKTEVTQSEYVALMGVNPSAYPSLCGDDCPVDQVSWYDAVAFANARSTAEGFVPCYDIADETVTVAGGETVYDCEGFRLPTEAEWEYAARANTTTPWFCGADDECVDGSAWYRDNSDGLAHAVGSKAANAFGIHDSMGNVIEWCWDRFADYEGDVTDPAGSKEHSLRIFRGGSYANEPRYLRSADRGVAGPGHSHRRIGFRLVRTAPSSCSGECSPSRGNSSPRPA